MTRPDPEQHWHHRKARGVSARVVFAALATVLLAGCFQEPPPNVAIEALTLDMAGFTRADVNITAPSHWVLEALPDDPTLAGAIAVVPATGSGNAVATVVVDPSATPRTEVRFSLRLTATHRGKQYVATSARFTFTYPEVAGVVVGGPGGAALELAPKPLASGHEPAPFGSGAGLDAYLAPELLAAPTTTLVVGLGPRGLVLRTTGAAAEGSAAPFAALQSAVGATVSRLGVTATAEPFEAAGLTLVSVPTGSALAAAAALRATPGVGYVEFPRLLEPASVDPLRSEQWNLDALDVEPMWGAAGGDGVTVAILDQGFLPSHPDLAPNVMGTYDAANGGAIGAPIAACGTHGTHVAGIAGAVANNGVGVAGVAPYAKLLLVNLGETTVSGCPMTSTTLIRALKYVANDGAPRAQVINMSLGSKSTLGEGVRNAIVAADALGISLVAAAGNDNNACPVPTSNPIFYPAAYPEVLAVAATEPSGLRACYSHRGPEMFLAAPGGSKTEGVLSTIVTFPGGTSTAGYGKLIGTSMASPAVAGVMAMLRSAAPTASKSAIALALSTTAIDLGARGRDPEYGFGFVNAAGAYTYLMDGPGVRTRVTLRVEGCPDISGASPVQLLPGCPYPPDEQGAFRLPEVQPGPLTVLVSTDDDGDGVFGESGEWFGEATIEVRFGVYSPDPANSLTITISQVP